MMEYYILRIYRHDENKPGSIAGIVESVEHKGKKAFTTMDELWGILKRSGKKSRKDDDNTKTETRRSL